MQPAWWRWQCPPRSDVALAVGLAALGVGLLLPYEGQLHPFVVAAALVAVQGLPLALRRQAPVPVLIAVAAARIGYDAAGFGWAPLPLAVALAVFTVADRASPTVRRIAAPVTAATVVVSQYTTGTHNQPYDVTVALLTFATAWVAGIAARNHRAYTAEVESRAQAAEVERAAAVSRAAAEERQRIARELHDVVAHHVSLVAVQAEAAATLLPDRPAEAAESVGVIGRTARAALADLRVMLGVLRTPEEPAELSPGLRLAELTGVLAEVRRTGTDIDLEVTGPVRTLPAGVEAAAYRIVQEALTNAVRHARGHRVAVRLDYEPGALTVAVANEAPDPAGQLPVPRAESPGAGLGLSGIAERVAACSGQLSVGPTAAGGFAVRAILPLP